MAANKGLGRGFDALLPQQFDASLLLNEDEKIQKIPLSDLLPNPEQPRKQFDDDALEELASSLKRHGVLQPLVASPGDKGKYHIVAGERRWRAAKIAGLSSVPVIVKSSKELERLEIALVENVQRVDLSPLEQADSIGRLHEQFNLDYDAVAKRLGKAKTTVINIARLLQLSEEAKDALREGKITEGHARAILALKDTKLQKELLELIEKEKWTVRQAENFVTAHKSGVKKSANIKERVSATTPETMKLSKLLKTNVSLRRTAKGGKLEIAFKSESDLKRIIKLFKR